MKITALNQRQIFVTKRSALEMKALQYFDESQDSATLIEYVVAVLVKNALVVGDYSLFLYDLIRELYLSADANAAMRKYMPYFQNYFSKKEWDGIINRLFKNKTNYFQNTKAARDSYAQLIKPTTNRELLDDEKNRKVNIESVFEDENGKRHRWVLSDVDPLKDKKDFGPILEILTTLSIFKDNGTRKFTKLVKSRRVFSEGEDLVVEEPKPKKTKRKKAPSKKEQQKSIQMPSVQSKKTSSKKISKAILPTDIDPRGLSKKDYEELARAVIPKDADLKDYYFEVTDPDTGEVNKVSFDGEKIGSDTEADSMESIRKKTKQSNSAQKAAVATPEKKKRKTAALASVSKEAEKVIAVEKEEIPVHEPVKPRGRFFGFFSRNKTKSKDTIDY